MFKVICIEEMDVPGGQIVPTPCPAVTEECTVICSEVYRGFPCFELAEYPPFQGQRLLFDQEGFALLNGPDESDRLEGYLQEQENMDRVMMAIAETTDEPTPQDAPVRVWKGVEAKLNQSL